ncbi:hypothetical protein, partial [Klebsiella pneumoniae]|uniref:hypothetical protein n=1 Tax=Klebsiella pneumoniae TaxID=573 RepID=UPI0038BE09F6
TQAELESLKSLVSTATTVEEVQATLWDKRKLTGTAMFNRITDEEKQLIMESINPHVAGLVKTIREKDEDKVLVELDSENFRTGLAVFV